MELQEANCFQVEINNSTQSVLITTASKVLGPVVLLKVYLVHWIQRHKEDGLVASELLWLLSNRWAQ